MPIVAELVVVVVISVVEDAVVVVVVFVVIASVMVDISLFLKAELGMVRGHQMWCSGGVANN